MRIAVDGTYFGVLPSLTSEPLIALAVGCGSQGLNWPFHPNFDMDDPTKVRRLLDAAGLGVVSIGLNNHSSAIPGSEAAWRDHVAQASEAANILGTRVLDCWPRRMPEVAKADAQATLRANVEAVLPVLQSHGVVLSLEFEPDHTVERYPEAIEFVQPYLPSVALTADSYHVFRIGDDLAAAGKALGPSLAILHASGSHRGEVGSEGDLCDHAAFINAAKSAGYAGDVLLQYQTKENALESLTRAVKFISAIV
ncbi:sugar phosphate isomerase/epimerase [bacterium]|nr:sugar phosphate isomerase/epimerase [bacterium]